MRNDCRVLHETVVKDIMDLFDLIRDTDLEDIIDSSKRNPYSKTSLAKLTDNLVCVFPVMVSSSLSIDSAVMIMKAIERKAAVMPIRYKMQITLLMYLDSSIKILS